MNIVSAPLYRDPIYDAPTDPVIIWNEKEQQWWMLYTQRRSSVNCIGVSHIHGTAIGVASSVDGNRWLYRGTLQGLDFEPGHNTFWAPEIIFAEGKYHMYVSYITGVPTDWNWSRHIVHYTADDLWQWHFESILELSSDRVIDACVYPVGDGKYKMCTRTRDMTPTPTVPSAVTSIIGRFAGKKSISIAMRGPTYLNWAAKNG